MTRESKHGLWTHRFRVIRELDEAEEMIGLDAELAACNDVHLAHLCFEHAVKNYDGRKLKLMHGSMVMCEYPEYVRPSQHNT